MSRFSLFVLIVTLNGPSTFAEGNPWEPCGHAIDRVKSELIRIITKIEDTFGGDELVALDLGIHMAEGETCPSHLRFEDLPPELQARMNGFMKDFQRPAPSFEGLTASEALSRYRGFVQGQIQAKWVTSTRQKVGSEIDNLKNEIEERRSRAASR